MRGQDGPAALVRSVEIAFCGFLVCALSGGFLTSWFPYILIGLMMEFEAVAPQAPWVYLAGVAGLLLVLSPVGQTVNGSRSWLFLPGGFSLQPANINIQIVPGFEHVVTVTPNQAGTYSVVCNEYCGINHHTMVGRLYVK